jgi:multiple sugar transport system permease protein
MAEQPASRSPSVRKWTRNPEGLAGPLMATPGFIGLILFVALPFILALGMSFTNLRLGSPLPTKFIGLEQYQRVLADGSFQRALLNNLIFAAVVVPVQTAFALVLAVLLNTNLKGTSIFRSLFFLPVVFPLALIAVVWELIYAPGPNGLMNAFLQWITFGRAEPIDFLNNAYFALPAIMLTSIWQGVGFQMVILLAGLQSIPQILYDAAASDGASRTRQFWHVTLPQLRNPLIFTGLVTTILSFRLYDQVQIMTQGGPNDASTTVMYETIRTVFDRYQIGQASAMTVVFFIIVLIITILQRILVKEEKEIT